MLARLAVMVPECPVPSVACLISLPVAQPCCCMHGDDPLCRSPLGPNGPTVGSVNSTSTSDDPTSWQAG